VASEARNRSLAELERVEVSVRSAENFTANQDRAQPEDIRRVAEECLASKLELREEEIVDLGQRINAAVDSASDDVDQILRETGADAARAEALRQRADAAKADAEATLAEAEGVVASLAEASDAQDGADEAVTAAQVDIDDARKDLSQVDSQMDRAVSSSDQSVVDVQFLAARHQPLQTDFIKNENRVNASREAAAQAKEKASAANAVLYEVR